jgi:tRNA(adenine34) deaminase
MRAMDDRELMTIALEEARTALAHDDVPIGCVVARDGEVLVRARNRRELDRDPTAHAEIIVLREASQEIGSWRLDGCTVYVTLEPCAMCAGAMVLARVDRLVYGAPDPKAGAVRSLFNIVDDPRLNHRVEITAGMLEEECSAVLREFFAARRS